MELLLDIQSNQKQVVIRINGVMDIATMDAFHVQMEQLPATFSSLLLDFSNLEFIDSTGIGAIVELIYLSQEKNFTIMFEGMNEDIEEIFEMLGVFRILEALKKEGA
ncbi:STAS domain-containing protein [Bacillus sp. BRMEA1]|uniref:STAS domain-containing protein n=1 Tax=Neobacillus endophyticus TaxID=2738405 RepID=UPI001566FFA6|nr:STAS domain-containing protein [Neobacillus endophyticus]NRD76886.1 STAS domain-containing protein [Neobacillus endophyticus]